MCPNKKKNSNRLCPGLYPHCTVSTIYLRESSLLLRSKMVSFGSSFSRVVARVYSSSHCFLLDTPHQAPNSTTTPRPPARQQCLIYTKILPSSLSPLSKAAYFGLSLFFRSFNCCHEQICLTIQKLLLTPTTHVFSDSTTPQ